ncbi:MAG: pyridoxamine 5'-phosphate oxidase [Phycisphaeraceae bacterium]
MSESRPSIADVRRDYTGQALRESDLADDPVEQFQRWLEDARQVVEDPTAMTLATAGADGMPSARVLLLKAFSHAGFVFYTSYVSDKAAELADNPRATMLFWWPPLFRSVRVAGPVVRGSRAEAEAYFATRPRESQIGAWASRQSRAVASREVLARRLVAAEQRFEGRDVPTPPDWGGYRLLPRRFEYWQGQPSRFHDRLLYTRGRDGAWMLQRLCP